MAVKTREELKKYFKPGNKTTEGQWYDVIDSLFNILDDGDDLIAQVYEKILYVDAASTMPGEKGKITRPYANPNLAQADAVAGDVIFIFPGDYTCSNLFKPGVTYYALPGVTIQYGNYSGVGPPALFEDFTDGAGVCKFLGYAKLTSGSFFLLVSNEGTQVFLECEEIIHDVGASWPAFITYYSDNYLKINVRNKIFKRSVAPLIAGDALWYLKAELLEFVGLIDASAIVLGGGGCVFDVRRVKHTGSSSTDSIFLEGPSVVRDCIIESNCVTLISSVTNNDVLFDNVRCVMSPGSLPPGYFGTAVVPSAGSGKITLKNSELIISQEVPDYTSLGNGTYTILGALTTNIPKDPGAVIYGGDFIYDSELKTTNY